MRFCAALHNYAVHRYSGNYLTKYVGVTLYILSVPSRLCRMLNPTCQSVEVVVSVNIVVVKMKLH